MSTTSRRLCVAALCFVSLLEGCNSGGDFNLAAKRKNNSQEPVKKERTDRQKQAKPEATTDKKATPLKLIADSRQQQEKTGPLAGKQAIVPEKPKTPTVPLPLLTPERQQDKRKAPITVKRPQATTLKHVATKLLTEQAPKADKTPKKRPAFIKKIMTSFSAFKPLKRQRNAQASKHRAHTQSVKPLKMSLRGGGDPEEEEDQKQKNNKKRQEKQTRNHVNLENAQHADVNIKKASLKDGIKQPERVLQRQQINFVHGGKSKGMTTKMEGVTMKATAKMGNVQQASIDARHARQVEMKVERLDKLDLKGANNVIIQRRQSSESVDPIPADKARAVLQDNYTDKHSKLKNPFGKRRKKNNRLGIEQAQFDIAFYQEEKKEQAQDQLEERHQRKQKIKKNISVRDLFKPIEIKGRRQPVNSVLLLGPAGLGKTTLTRQIAYGWANGQRQEWEDVYLLPVRNLKKKEYDHIPQTDRLATAVVEKALGIHRSKEDFIPMLKRVKEQLKSDKTLLILDGLDEKEGASELLLEEAQKGAHKLLMTSRPYNTADFAHELEVELQTLSPERVAGYARQYLGGESESLLAFLEEHQALRELAAVPVTLQMLCALWEDEEERNLLGKTGGSPTKLYQSLTRYIWKRYAEKDKQKAPGRNNKHRNALFQVLGRIALTGMVKGEIIISAKTRDEVLAETDDDITADFQLQESGFLEEMTGSKLLEEVGLEYAFPHLTFQEYFAGQELARMFLEDNDEAEEFLNKHKYEGRYQVMLQFAAGAVYQHKNKKKRLAAAKKLFAALDAVQGDKLQHNLLQMRCLNEWLGMARKPQEQAALRETFKEPLESFHKFLETGMRRSDMRRYGKYDYKLNEELIKALSDLKLVPDKRAVELYTKALANGNWDAVSALDRLAEGPLYEEIVQALKKEREKDMQGRYGETALMHAAQRGHTAAVRALIEAGTNKDIQDKNGRTVLMYAIEHRNPGATKVLLEAGANKDMQDKNGKTALMGAAANGQTAIVEALLKSEAETDIKDTNGWTALMSAAANGHTAIVKALLKSEAETDIKDTNGWTALIWAAANGRTDIVAALIETGADKDMQNEEGVTALMWAARNGCTDIVKALIEAGADKDMQNEEGVTALIWAARYGRTDIVKALIEAGAKKDVQDKSGVTALMWAAANGRTDIVAALIETGANKDIQTKRGWTALMIALRNGHTAAARALIEAGEEKDMQNKKGSTALMWAALNGRTDILKALIEVGADKDMQKKYDITALMWAAANGHIAVITALIEAGVDKDMQAKNGRTALMYAAQEGHTDIAKALLEAGAKKDVQDKSGRTALMWAARNGCTDIVKALLEAGAKKDVQDKYGLTALMIAVRYGQEKIAKALLEAEAKKDVQDKSGWTALIFAAHNGHTDIVKSLIEAGVNKDIQNKDGLTALMIAKQYFRQTIVKLLKRD